MCRLYGFRANEETKIECTLIHAQNALMLQSRTDLRGVSHADGWGLAFYHDSIPETERRATAAYEDLHFSSTAERIYTCSAVAHIRRATVGGPSLENSHPFTNGPWTFAHNGTVIGFENFRETLLRETSDHLRSRLQGTTDSEHAFYWLLTRMESAGLSATDRCSDLELMRKVVTDSVNVLAGRCRQHDPGRTPRLNFLLTDGHVLIATRYHNSLYWLLREGIRDCEICGIPHVHHSSGVDYRAVVVASEPITHEDWQEAENESILVVDSGIHVKRYGLDGSEPLRQKAALPNPAKAEQ
jgi:glutamine amidotransferase